MILILRATFLLIWSVYVLLFLIHKLTKLLCITLYLNQLLVMASRVGSNLEHSSDSYRAYKLRNINL